MMHKVSVDGHVLMAQDGSLLAEVLNTTTHTVEQPCGGRGTCGKCTVLVDGQKELACRYRIRHDITVSLPAAGEMLSETGALATGDVSGKLCFALDVGTTTLALALVSLDTRQIVRVVTRTNPQRAFGADVMTRIAHCRQHGPSRLHDVLIGAVNDMIANFALPEVDTLYVAGNTTMLHLFFCVDCSGMGAAPYTPVFLEERSSSAASLGLRGIDCVQSLPGISAFVGADLVAGLNHVDLPTAGQYRLLIDLGTNAEIILFSRDTVLCTAAAAGPCFEGANISCGMSATSGAICACALDEDGGIHIKTIADAPAQGICGTGLIDAVAELVSHEIIDETGFMEDGGFTLAPGVTLTQADVRQFQLAKSAVCSGILSLMKEQRVSAEQIDGMYISGGFSAKINIANAARAGLLPAELCSKAIAVNNSSLLGTVRFAWEQSALSRFLRHARYLDLSSNQTFSALFIENMMF